MLTNFQLEVEVAALRSKQEALAKAPPPAPVEAAPAADSAPVARTVDDLGRQLMIDALAAEEGSEKPLWIRVDPRDREASRFSAEIAGVFRDQGWDVKVLDNDGLRFKPGLLFLVASEDEPPSYITNAQRAIEAIGEPLTAGRGYLPYYQNKKKEDPNWQGTEFLPEQTYVLLVGRLPE